MQAATGGESRQRCVQRASPTPALPSGLVKVTFIRYTRCHRNLVEGCVVWHLKIMFCLLEAWRSRHGMRARERKSFKDRKWSKKKTKLGFFFLDSLCSIGNHMAALVCSSAWSSDSGQWLLSWAYQYQSCGQTRASSTQWYWVVFIKCRVVFLLFSTFVLDVNFGVGAVIEYTLIC